MVEMAPSSNLGNQVLALAAAHRLGEVGERAATQVVFPHTRRMTLSGQNNCNDTDGTRTLPWGLCSATVGEQSEYSNSPGGRCQRDWVHPRVWVIASRIGIAPASYRSNSERVSRPERRPIPGRRGWTHRFAEDGAGNSETGAESAGSLRTPDTLQFDRFQGERYCHSALGDHTRKSAFAKSWESTPVGL
jgi:hypothetical protein